MNIFKTFETFLKEPLSILRDNIIQIVSIQTGNIFENKPSCDVTVMKDKTQITVVNNEKPAHPSRLFVIVCKVNCGLSSDDIVGRGLAPAVQY
jgi:hypothetical protein